MPINNNPQTPPAQNLPDHRIDEIQQELGRLRDENNRLRGHIDYISRGVQQPQQQQPKNSPFEENVDRALTEKINQMIQERVDPVATQFKNQLGYLLDQQDDVRFQYMYGTNDKYSKFVPKIEKIRRDYEARGQYITREDALRMVYFEETGKKPTEAPPQQPQASQQQPVWDPYFGTFVDPTTRKPVSMVQEIPQEAPEIEGQPPQNPTQPWQPTTQQTPWQGHHSQHPQQQQLPPQQMAPGQKPSQHPFQNPYGNLPAQGVNQPFAAAPAQPKGHLNLDLAADDNALKAFEDQYGDIPL